MGIMLILLLEVLVVGTLPTWGYSQRWGYRGPGIVGVLLFALIVLLVMGVLPLGF